MSFETLKIDELRQIAESFGVDLESAKTKIEIVAALTEEGVTYEMYKQFSEAEKDELEEEEIPEEPVVKKSKPKKNDSSVLVKMERKNFSYETYGHTFTYEHPYVAMSEKDAQLIFDNEEGFRMATPKEVQEYYS